jgi:4-amino-4-deoxy-L-arabinose transferase-like glycosyltransferase
VLDEVDTVLKPYEPPLLELAATAFYRATGGERIWFPRLLSTLAWLAGAVCLAFLALRLTNAAGMLTAVALYLAWPYAFWQSRKFMPDSLLVACVLAATLAIVRYWERPSRARFVGAAAAAAIATAIKPGVGLFFVVAVFVALALAHGRLREELRSGRPVVFAGIAASLAVLYFVIGKATSFTHPDAGSGRLLPEYALNSEFWTGWWDMVSFLLRTPQHQEILAVAALALGVLGLLLTPRGVPRAILWGLTGGYVLFALAFARYTSSHPYYALPLIPILALAIGVVVGRLSDRLSQRPPARVALALVVAAVVGMGTYKAYATIAEATPPTQTIADYRRIGELTHHTTRAIVVNPSLAHPVMYWGWIVGQEWDLGEPVLPSFIDPSEKDYLIVVGNDALQSSPGLRAFARGRRVVAQTERFTIFALREGV